MASMFLDVLGGNFGDAAGKPTTTSTGGAAITSGTSISGQSSTGGTQSGSIPQYSASNSTANVVESYKPSFVFNATATTAQVVGGSQMVIQQPTVNLMSENIPGDENIVQAVINPLAQLSEEFKVETQLNNIYAQSTILVDNEYQDAFTSVQSDLFDTKNVFLSGNTGNKRARDDYLYTNPYEDKKRRHDYYNEDREADEHPYDANKVHTYIHPETPSGSANSADVNGGGTDILTRATEAYTDFKQSGWTKTAGGLITTGGTTYLGAPGVVAQYLGLGQRLTATASRLNGIANSVHPGNGLDQAGATEAEVGAEEYAGAEIEGLVQGAVETGAETAIETGVGAAVEAGVGEAAASGIAASLASGVLEAGMVTALETGGLSLIAAGLAVGVGYAGYEVGHVLGFY